MAKKKMRLCSLFLLCSYFDFYHSKRMLSYIYISKKKKLNRLAKKLQNLEELKDKNRRDTYILDTVQIKSDPFSFLNFVFFSYLFIPTYVTLRCPSK